MDRRLDPARLDDLFVIGVDEIAWRKRHQYLTLVSDHRSRKIVWGAPGKDTATLDRFFDELGTERAVGIQAGLHGHEPFLPSQRGQARPCPPGGDLHRPLTRNSA